LISDDYPGPSQGAAALLYRNDDRRWPEFAGRDLARQSPGVRFLNLASTGHTSLHVQEQVRHLPPGRGEVLVALAVGGNDLLGWLAEGADPVAGMAAYARRLTGILRELASRYPRRRVLVANVYDPSDGTGRTQSGKAAFPQALPLLAELNRTISRTARAEGGVLVDVYRHFLGHGLRHADPSYEHYHPEDPSGWIFYDIEPNPRGASEIRRLLWQAAA
jgi:lysophospholipase L1-like esterase